jgi:hypothetical protein
MKSPSLELAVAFLYVLAEARMMESEGALRCGLTAFPTRESRKPRVAGTLALIGHMHDDLRLNQEGSRRQASSEEPPLHAALLRPLISRRCPPTLHYLSVSSRSLRYLQILSRLRCSSDLIAINLRLASRAQHNTAPACRVYHISSAWQLC